MLFFYTQWISWTSVVCKEARFRLLYKYNFKFGLNSLCHDQLSIVIDSIVTMTLIQSVSLLHNKCLLINTMLKIEFTHFGVAMFAPFSRVYEICSCTLRFRLGTAAVRIYATKETQIRTFEWNCIYFKWHLMIKVVSWNLGQSSSTTTQTFTIIRVCKQQPPPISESWLYSLCFP